ncbi:MAG TPA: hypothetical protein VI758_08060 [Bacteroidota bacterium]
MGNRGEYTDVRFYCQRIWTILLMLEILAGLSLVLCDRTLAQDTTEAKSEPATRQLTLPITAPDSNASAVRSTMPKIDLPKYVITGSAIIDLPLADKLPAQEDEQASSLQSILNSPLTRSRQTVQSELNNKEEVQATQAAAFNGNAYAELGTYFSPQAGLWFGRKVSDYYFSADGQYYRTRGFAPYTDRSGGNFGLKGETVFNSYNPLFDQSTLDGNVRYRADTYNWYGTRRPSVSRNRTDFAFSANLSNWNNSRFPYSFEAGIENFFVGDSSANVYESRLYFVGATRLSLASVPLNASVQAQLGSISYSNSNASLAFFEGVLGSQHYTWGAYSLVGSVHGYIAEGMENQRLMRLYPHLNVAYRINSFHNLRFTYAPGILASTLSSDVFANRNLSATSKIKHIDDQYDGALALESDWSENTRTKLEARVQSMVDYPLYADSLAQRVWFLAYGGRTTIASFSGEVFAKLRANDYFAVALAATVSRNSAIESQVPYVPAIELGCRYTGQIAEQFSGAVTLTLIHQEKDNVVNVSTMPSILLVGLRGEYRILEQLKAFLDVQNLLNETYEYWKGYQENPFVVSIGLVLRW